MRHFTILLVVTMVMSAITWTAFQYDRSRPSAQDQMEKRISADAFKLEQQYLRDAHTLLSIVVPGDSLLNKLEMAQQTLAQVPLLADREPLFQDLVSQVQVRMLNAAIPAGNDAVMQEWRHLTDQMNGALHRREQLLKRLEQS